jgi:hypothetical protein
MAHLANLVVRPNAATPTERRAMLSAFFAPQPCSDEDAAAAERTRIVHTVMNSLQQESPATGAVAQAIVDRLLAAAERGGPDLVAVVKRALVTLAALSPRQRRSGVLHQMPPAQTAKGGTGVPWFEAVADRPEVIRALRWSTAVDPAAAAAVPHIDPDFEIISGDNGAANTRFHRGREHEDDAPPSWLPPDGNDSAVASQVPSYWATPARSTAHANIAPAESPMSSYVDASPPVDLDVGVAHDEAARKAAAKANALPLDALRTSSLHPRAIIPILVAVHRAVLGMPDPYGFLVPSADADGSLEVRSSLPLQLCFLRPILSQLVESGNAMLALTTFSVASDRPSARSAMGSYGAAEVHALVTLLRDTRDTVLRSLELRLDPAYHVNGFRCIAEAALVLRKDECRRLLTLKRLFGLDEERDRPWRVDDSIACCGVRLLTSLGLRADAGDDSVEARMFAIAVGPFAHQLCRWVALGDLAVDVHDEFFVMPSHGESASGFHVDPSDARRPGFVSLDAAEDCVEAGVAARLLLSVIGRDSAKALDAFQSVSRFTAADTDDPVEHLCEVLRDWISALEHFVTHHIVAEIEAAVGRQNDELRGRRAVTELALRDHNEVTVSPSGTDATVMQPPAAAVQTQQHDDAASTAALSMSTAAEQWKDYMEEAKEIARQRILQEHAQRMRVAELRGLLLDWKARRMALQPRRKAALMSMLEEVNETFAQAEAEDRQVVLMLPPTIDAGASPRPDDDVPIDRPGLLDDSLTWRSGYAAAPLRNDDEDILQEHDSVGELTADGEGDMESYADRLSNAEDAVRRYETDVDDLDTSHVRDDDVSAPADVEVDEVVSIPEVPVPEGASVDAELTSDEERRHALVEQDDEAASYNEEDCLRVFPSYMPEVEEPKRAPSPSTARAILAEVERQQYQRRPPRPEANHFANDSSPDPWRPLLAPHLRRHRAQARGDVRRRLDDLAQDARRRLTGLALRVMFCPAARLSAHCNPGRLGSVCRGLLDVFLMQRSVPVNELVDSWTAVCFPVPAQQRGAANAATASAPHLPTFDADVAYLTMSRSWSRLWATCGVQVPLTAWSHPVRVSDADTPLVVILEADYVQRGKEAAPRTAFDLLGAVTFTSRENRAVEELWLMPADYASRYGLVFKTLIFWRFVDHLAKQVWSVSGATGLSQGWLFATAVRGVFGIIMSHVWHATSAAAKDFLSSITAAKAVADWTSVERFRAEHDEFLAVCHAACLLTAPLAKARRTMHGMVRLLAEVHHSTYAAADRAVLSRFVAKRRQDFIDATRHFILQLKESGAGAALEMNTLIGALEGACGSLS